MPGPRAPTRRVWRRGIASCPSCRAWQFSMVLLPRAQASPDAGAAAHQLPATLPCVALETLSWCSAIRFERSHPWLCSRPTFTPRPALGRCASITEGICAPRFGICRFRVLDPRSSTPRVVFFISLSAVSCVDYGVIPPSETAILACRGCGMPDQRNVYCAPVFRLNWLRSSPTRLTRLSAAALRMQSMMNRVSRVVTPFPMPACCASSSSGK